MPSGCRLFKLGLKAGAADKASISAKAKGVHATLPALPLPLPGRVQLQASQGGCWQATYSAAGSSDNTSTQFRGKAD